MVSFGLACALPLLGSTGLIVLFFLVEKTAPITWVDNLLSYLAIGFLFVLVLMTLHTAWTGSKFWKRVEETREGIPIERESLLEEP